MPWFKVDDDLPFHQKVVMAGNAAMGLWVRSGAWSAQQLTDGFVPDNMIELIGTPAQRRRLVAVALWVEVDGGCMFYGWNKNGRQPTAQSVREKRAEAAKRQQEYRERKTGRFQASSQVNESRNAVTASSVTPSVTREVTASVTPAPTRPDPKRRKDSLTDAAASAAFEEFWTHYPRKVDKRAAHRAYTSALTRGVTPGRILTAVKTYAATCQGTEPRFIKHASTWLNAGSYDDTPEHLPRAAGNAAPADYTGPVMER